ncbi:MAG: GNAT family N-acetyltransferase [Candidatus Thorarchaeota archaeon]
MTKTPPLDFKVPPQDFSMASNLILLDHQIVNLYCSFARYIIFSEFGSYFRSFRIMMFYWSYAHMSVNERVLVRFAGPEDLEWCVVEDGHVTEQVIRHKIVQNEIIVAELDGKPIGYIRIEFLWSTIPYIGVIFVVDEYRHEGIGRKILVFLEDYLKSIGHDQIYSSSQANEPEPQAWHRSVGFEECGIISGINEGGIGEVFFRKPLV